MEFFLTSSTPLPEGARIDGVHFDSEKTACQVSDAAPGGFGGLSLGYKSFIGNDLSGTLGTPVGFVDLGHVQIFANDEKGFLVFEGRLETMDSPDGKSVTAITATGYGVGSMAATTDMWFSRDPYSGEPTVGGGQLIRDVLASSAPLLVIGDKDQFIEPGGAYLVSTESGRYPNQTVDEVIKAGDSSNHQLIYLVYEDRVVQLRPRTPPLDPVTGEVVADYYVPADRTRVQWRRSSTLLVGAVAVQYTDVTDMTTAHTDVSSNAAQQQFRDAHGGLLRGYLVPNSSWTQAQADFFRDTYLAKYSQPVITCVVSADDKWPVFNAVGGAIPWYMVRSGGWLKVADQDPILVTSTAKDLMARTLQITASSV